MESIDTGIKIEEIKDEEVKGVLLTLSVEKSPIVKEKDKEVVIKKIEELLKKSNGSSHKFFIRDGEHFITIAAPQDQKKEAVERISRLVRTLMNLDRTRSEIDYQRSQSADRDANSRRVYVGNLPYTTTEERLKALFNQVGAVKSINIITHNDGRSRGFAFIEMSSLEEVERAVLELDGHRLEGRRIKVAKKR